MADSYFPVLPGLTWSVGKTPEFSTIVKQSANGAETRIALWSAPRWHFKLTYALLRDIDPVLQTDPINELKALAGFFLQRQGQYQDFLYEDPNDNHVVGQLLGTGDGKITGFQCIRDFGGFIEPIKNFDMTTDDKLGRMMKVYQGGTLQTSGWSVDSNGMLNFVTAPATGVAVTIDFYFYFRVRFDADSADFEQFMRQLWELKTCELVSVK